MQKFKFSVLIPSYNGAQEIGYTIQSVLNQDYPNFEIIVNDDASKDSTEKVVKSFKDKRVNFFKNKKNLGYPGNLNEKNHSGFSFNSYSHLQLPRPDSRLPWVYSKTNL